MSTDDKIIEAMKKFDEKTKERLAKKIMVFAEEETMSASQKNCIRALKVVCPVGLLLTAPVVTYLFTQLQKGIDPLVFGLSLIPLIFLGIITAIVNVLLKTPE